MSHHKPDPEPLWLKLWFLVALLAALYGWFEHAT